MINRGSRILLLVGLVVVQVMMGARRVEAAVKTIPFQYHRGWWYTKIPLSATSLRLRITVPYELPSTAHFHVMLLPQKDDKTFMGDRAEWPKSWVWQDGASPLIALPHMQVVKEKSGMPIRVAPSLMKEPVGDTLSASWGEYTWEWTRVTSRYQYQGVTPHAPVKEFLRGGRTTWLDLKTLIDTVNPPANATSYLVAIAPYHQGAAGDEAFACYPPKGSAVPPVHPRQDGDYPNDPLIIWEPHHEELEASWRGGAAGYWAGVFGVFGADSMRLAEQFPEAWLMSTYNLTCWSTRPLSSFANVGIRRLSPIGISLPREMSLNQSVGGLVTSAALLPGTIVKGYHKMFQVLRDININPQEVEVTPPTPGGPTPPAMVSFLIPELPTLDIPLMREWLVRRSGGPLSKSGFERWVAESETAYPGIVAVFNSYLDRLATWLAMGNALPFGDLTFILLCTYCDYTYGADPGMPLRWQNNQGVWDPNRLPSALTSAMMSGPIPPGLITTLMDPLGFASMGDDLMVLDADAFGMPSASAANIRAPMGWGVLAPPLFGQLNALASPELMNLSWRWWRQSASGLANPALLALTGLDPAQFPWAGWSPIDAHPFDNGPASWWQQYNALPWAKPLKEPFMRQPVSAADWRFSGTSLAWPARLSEMTYWPPQPPTTRPSDNGGEYSQLVLPTAAYPLGPIEIDYRP